MSPPSHDTGPGHVVAPTQDDSVVRALSEVVGGPYGRRARGHRFWTPVRVVLAMVAVCFAVGLLQKTDCYADDWADSQSRYTHMCYSDLPYLYTGRGFAEAAWPYTDDQTTRSRYETMEYPVGISYWAFGTALVTHALSDDVDLDARRVLDLGSLYALPEVAGESKLFVVVNAIGLGVLAIIAAWFLTGVNPGRPWDAAGFALAPTLALSGLVNWDLLAVMFVCGALWAWTRGSPVWTGVMIGLGTAAKLYPLFLLGALLVICVRQRRFSALVVTVSTTLLAWLAANAPAYLSSPEQWRVFWSFNSERGADLGSIWLVAQQARDNVAIDISTINQVSLIFFAAWCALVLVVGLAAPSTPRFAQLGLLIMVGFLLVNKVYSPQYVLWLLPLAVMARPRWRDLLIWQAGEVLYFASVWWYLGGFLAPGGGGESKFYWLAIVLRLAAELYLVAVVTRDVLRPEHDPAPAPPPDDDPDDDLDQSIETRSNAVAV